MNSQRQKLSAVKKILLQILFLVLVLPAISQNLVSISGIVTDTATGNPIPNQAVFISNDSTAGWIYHQTVYSNNIGFYQDTVPVPLNSTGTLYVRTIDCQNNQHETILNYNPTNLSFTVNFLICHTPSPGLPILSTGSASSTSYTSTVLNGFVNPNGSQTSVTFEFGTTSLYGTFLSCGYFNGNTLQPVNQGLSNLSPGTLYHYRINGHNSYGTAVGFDSTFITLPADSLPVAITNGATGITSSGATMHGLFNPNGHSCTIVIEWGLTTSYGGFSSTGGGSGFNYISDQATIYAFPPNTVVHYRASLIYAGGTVYGADSTFTTLGPTGCHSMFVTSHISGTNYSYQFTNQSTGNISTYTWNFGDGQSQTITTPQSPNVTHAYSQPGTYITCLTIMGSDSSCFDSSCDTLVVVPVGPQIYIRISGTVINVTASSPMANHAVTWGIDDTLTAPHTVYTNSNGFYADSLLLSPGVTAGNYYVWTQDCQSTTELSGPYNQFIYYNLHQDFNLNCESNLPCQAKIKVSAAGIMTVQLEDKSTGGVTSRVWDFGDGNTSTIENPVHTYSSLGDYVVTLSTANNITVCSSTITKFIHFGDSILCNVGIDFSYTQNPKTIQFQNLSSGGNGMRLWYFGDGDTTNMENPQHTFRYPGLYLVSLSIGHYSTPCWQTGVKAVLIGDSLLPCQSHFTHTINPAVNPKSVQFTDQSTGVPTQWQWYFGDGDSSAQRYPIHTYAASGTYHVCLTISGNYCTNTFCQDVVVQDSIIFHQVYGQVFAGNFPVSAGQAMIISVDTTGTFQPYSEVFPIDSNGVFYYTIVPEGNYYILATPVASSGYLPTYYGNKISWTQATSIPLGTPDNPYNINLVPSDQMPPGPGSVSGQINLGDLPTLLLDKVNMILLNAQGNPIGFTTVSLSGEFAFPAMAYGAYYLHPEMPGVTSDYIMVFITPEKPQANVVMTFTGNKIIGIRDEVTLMNHYSVYPNPVVDNLTVRIDMINGTKAEAAIFNLTGQTVISSQVILNAGNNDIVLSTASLPPGIYSLRIHSREGLILTDKIVKTR